MIHSLISIPLYYIRVFLLHIPSSLYFFVSISLCLSLFLFSFVTADIIAHQVLLNRVPEQATEDSVRYQIYY